MELKEKLHAQMSRLGLNGQKLARISGVSDSEISRILNGKSRPGLENAYRLAKAMGVSLDYLADDGLDVDPLAHADPLSLDEREVLDLARGIGLTKASRVLENIRIIGYETAMRRLLEARSAIAVAAPVEPDEEVRQQHMPAPSAPLAPMRVPSPI
ncbi:MAG: helix-turn-helix domain-containing protein [Isosphaeraceae bacterium]|nr:helix-turn-helix domain-containing protein [Isosphaeraceae bacterium]